MTAYGKNGDRNSSLQNQMTFVRLINNSSLPRRARNSVSLSTTVNLQVVQENNRDIKQDNAIISEPQAPPTHVNFESQYFQKLHEYMKRLKFVKGILSSKYFVKTGKVIYQQSPVPENYSRDIIRTLDGDIMWGHPGSRKMLYHLRQRYYCANLAAILQASIKNCQTCIKLERIAKHQVRPPVQMIHDPSNGPENLLEIGLVGPLPSSNG